MCVLNRAREFRKVLNPVVAQSRCRVQPEAQFEFSLSCLPWRREGGFHRSFVLRYHGMSKAFTREDDTAYEPAIPRPAALLPPGTRNLITPSGALRLRGELERLVRVERPRLAVEAAADPDARTSRAALDQRIRQIEHALNTMVVTGPPQTPDDAVRFGASVTVRDRSGETSRYRIVGADETDLDRDWVSWLSPIAKAVLNARVGDRVRLQLPGSSDELEILAVSYE
jgi:transcription elongation factor GreB